MRVLLVSSYYPPTIGGSSTTSANLACLINEFAEIEVVANDPYFYGGNMRSKPPEEVRRHELNVGLPKYHGPYSQLLRRTYRRMAANRVQSLIESVAADFRPTHIMAIYPDQYFFMAAEMVARRMGVPFLPYFYDLPTGEGSVAPLDDIIEIIKRSPAVMTLTAGVQEWLESQFQIPSTLIPHILNAKMPSAGEALVTAEKMERDYGIDFHMPYLLHTGVVEVLQRDSLRKILQAFNRLDLPDHQIILTTPHPSDVHLLFSDVLARNIHVRTFAAPEMRFLQQRARLLLAVLPFQEEYRDLGNTCFPTKIVEYLQTDVPIFLHIPPESALNTHAQRYGYGFVANQPEMDHVATVLRTALTDEEERGKVLKKARYTRETEFSSIKIQHQLQDLLRSSQKAMKLAS